MTPNEIQLFLCGVALGVQGMAVLHMVGDLRDIRRNEKVSREAMKRTAGDQYLNSLRLYRLQHRSRA